MPPCRHRLSARTRPLSTPAGAESRLRRGRSIRELSDRVPLNRRGPTTPPASVAGAGRAGGGSDGSGCSVSKAPDERDAGGRAEERSVVGFGPCARRSPGWPPTAVLGSSWPSQGRAAPAGLVETSSPSVATHPSPGIGERWIQPRVAGLRWPFPGVRWARSSRLRARPRPRAARGGKPRPADQGSCHWPDLSSLSDPGGLGVGWGGWCRSGWRRWRMAPMAGGLRLALARTRPTIERSRDGPASAPATTSRTSVGGGNPLGARTAIPTVDRTPPNGEGSGIRPPPARVHDGVGTSWTAGPPPSAPRPEPARPRSPAPRGQVWHHRLQRLGLGQPVLDRPRHP
jgi:hypothetical protein